MRRWLGVFLFLASLTIPALAQIPGGSVYAGYSYLTSGSLSSGPVTTSRNLSNPNGFNVAGELKLLPWISGVAGYGATFGTERITPGCEVIIHARARFMAIRTCRLFFLVREPRCRLEGLDRSRTFYWGERT
jgi:hypothetical protein